jgi:hemerythrin
MALRWTSALSIGVPEIDRQHEQLFEQVDRLHGAMLRRDRQEAASTLHFLERYVRGHFAAEDMLMRALDYPGRAEHIAEHAAFATTVELLIHDLETTGPTAALVHRLEREVTAWLEDHIYSTDLDLGRYVRSHHRDEVRECH